MLFVLFGTLGVMLAAGVLVIFLGLGYIAQYVFLAWILVLVVRALYRKLTS